MKITSRYLLPLLTLAALSTAAFAQAPAAPGAPGGNNNNGGNRGNFNPQDMMKRFEDRLKGDLKATDEEWTVIQPLLTNVTTKQRESRGGGMFGGRRDRGPGGNGDSSANNTPTSPSQAASQNLRTALEKDGASADELKSKLAAVRDSRKKSQAELATAREDLRKVLTLRQEAVLVSYGILE